MLIIDITRRKIRLSRERLKHISKHPNVRDKIDDIVNTLKKPLLITEHLGNIRYYYSYFKNRKKAKYLRVIVKYLNGKGFVITAHFVEKIK